MTSPVKESGLMNRCSQETDRNGRSGYYLTDLKKKFLISVVFCFTSTPKLNI